eukprot:6312032-Alexandrium_andersonii.AAC.1
MLPNAKRTTEEQSPKKAPARRAHASVSLEKHRWGIALPTSERSPAASGKTKLTLRHQSGRSD